MRQILIALTLALVLAGSASAVYDTSKIQAHGVYYELAQNPQQVTGGWEYWVDCYTNGGGSQNYGLWGPSTLYENMANLSSGVVWYGSWGEEQEILMQFWDQDNANGWYDAELLHPSQDTNGDQVWELTGRTWEYDNTVHLPNEYATGWEVNHSTYRKDAGTVWRGSDDPGDELLGQDLVSVHNYNWGWGHGAGLWFTMRIVSTDPLESLEWSLPDYGSNVGNWAPTPYSTLVDPDGIPGSGDEYLEEHEAGGTVWADHANAIDLIDTQTDWNTTIIELIDPDGIPDNGDEYNQIRAAVPGDPEYGVADGILDGSDSQAGTDGLADGGVDFDSDGDNDVFHENYGIYSVLGDFSTGAAPGDFDEDGDVDGDDVELLCANMGDAAYDLDGDGDADEDDLILMIETLVELQDGSGRIGTQRGDMNLDGLINGTDLAIMGVGYGGSGGYATGNLNCDALVNGTDLAILAANYGYTAPPAPVPEPASAAMLLVGGGALLRRRRRNG